MYDTEPLSSVVGGPIFRAGAGVDVVAYYRAAETDPEERFLIHPEAFSEQEKAVAVASQRVGQGSVVVVGVRPGFRAFWPYSFKLVSNAVFDAVADTATATTLP